MAMNKNKRYAQVVQVYLELEELKGDTIGNEINNEPCSLLLKDTTRLKGMTIIGWYGNSPWSF